MPNLRLMTIDDVEDDADLRKCLRNNIKVATYLSIQLAMMAGTLGAMLKHHDKMFGKNRRRYVVRPILLASGVVMLIARFLRLAGKRFEIEYGPELQAAGRRKNKPRGRVMKFGD